MFPKSYHHLLVLSLYFMNIHMHNILNCSIHLILMNIYKFISAYKLKYEYISVRMQIQILQLLCTTASHVPYLLILIAA